VKNVLLRCTTAMALAGTMACADEIAAPSNAEPAYMMGIGNTRNAIRLTILGHNVYVGADLDAVIASMVNGDPTDDLPALLAAITTLGETSFPVRAAALASEIEAARPHFVGLQELTKLDIQLPPLGVAINLDFLEILEAELQARGLNYVVAGKVDNASALLEPFPGGIISFADMDVLLVDAGRVTFDPATVVEQNFTANIGVVAPGINIIRGWVAVTATVQGQTFRVATTHLESGNSSPQLSQLRAAQAIELVTSVGSAPNAIVIGDMNDTPGSLFHQVLTGTGLIDSWMDMNPNQPGFTCCHLPDLSNNTSQGVLNRRFDYVFSRGALERRGDLRGKAELLGEVPGDRVSGPLHSIWPSDHAGILVELLFPPSNATCNAHDNRNGDKCRGMINSPGGE
jgi:hypothetical protein